MLNRSIRHRIGKWLAVAALLGFGLAMAQSEPTLKQIYEAAQAGRVEQAQVMVQQVLVTHPNSAKAHFVQAELFARQGELGRAREALATADKLAPGLPFAKSEAIQSLRTQLAAKTGAPAVKSQVGSGLGAGAISGVKAPVPAAPSSPIPWGMILALGGAAIAIGIFLLRKKPAAAPLPTPQQPAYASQAVNPGAVPGAMQGGLNGPQSFGMGSGAAPGAPAYGQPYGQQAAGSGIGGKVMGGLATGLAVGAGVMAAQAIGKSLMGNDDHAARQPGSAANNSNDQQPFASNTGNNDLGGQNFGVDDAGSWDDGSTVAGNDGGGDWDT